MSKKGYPYENAVAERVNGILEEEMGLKAFLEDLAAARRAVKEAVEIYNEERPHMSLGYQRPEDLLENSMKT